MPFDPDDPFLGLTQDELNRQMRAPGGVWGPPAVQNGPRVNRNNRPPINRAARAAQGVPQMFGDHGLNQAFGGFNMAQAMAGQQGRHLQGMADDVMGAINQENRSRVAQMREQARMEHEKELERIRQQTEQMKVNALIQRLNQQNTAGFSNPAEGLYVR